MNRPHLQFIDLTLGYDRHPAVHHLDARIEPGSLLAVVGPNGAGKSTLLKGIAGLLKPLGGQLRLTGIRRRQLAYLPQQSALDRSFPIRVFDLVALGLWGRLGAFRGLDRRRARQVAEALTAVGLTGFDDRPIDSLSGGQFQRALFARLLLQDAPLILLDEPFTTVDQRTARDLLALVRRWHGEQRTVIVVLHDLEQVRAHFPDTRLTRQPAQHLQHPVEGGQFERTFLNRPHRAAFANNLFPVSVGVGFYVLLTIFPVLAVMYRLGPCRRWISP